MDRSKVVVIYHLVCYMVCSEIERECHWFCRPYVCVLGQMPGTDIYRDVSVYKEVTTQQCQLEDVLALVG